MAVAESEENVGGIAVSAAVSIGEAQAELQRLLAYMKEVAQQAQGLLSFEANVAVNGGQMPGAGGGGYYPVPTGGRASGTRVPRGNAGDVDRIYPSAAPHVRAQIEAAIRANAASEAAAQRDLERLYSSATPQRRPTAPPPEQPPMAVAAPVTAEAGEVKAAIGELVDALKAAAASVASATEARSAAPVAAVMTTSDVQRMAANGSVRALTRVVRAASPRDEAAVTAARAETLATAGVAEPGEEEQTGNQGGALIADRAERARFMQQRREAEARNADNALVVDRSEQALWHQRQREESAARRPIVLRTAAAAQLRPLSAANAALAGPALPPGGSVLASRAETANEPSRSPGPEPARATEEQAAALRARAETRRAVSGQTRQRQRDAERLATMAPERETPGRLPTRTEEDVARRAEERVTTAVAGRMAAARTPHTLASSLGGFLPFIGQTRAYTEATARQAAAEQNLSIARARLNDPKVIANARAYRHATEEVTAAETEAVAAAKDMERFTGFGAAAKGLASVTIAGAAFSAGMMAMNEAVRAVEPAVAAWIDQMGGFASTSTRVTTALAAQTQAVGGWTQVAIAQKAATAGLDAAATDYLTTQLKLTTSVKAGAQAQAQASDLFRAAAGLGGGVPQGVLGGYGGLFGTALFGSEMGGGKGYGEQLAGDFAALANQKVAIGPLSTAGRSGPEAGRYGQAPGSQNPANYAIDPKAFAAMTAEMDNATAEMARGARALGATADATYKVAAVNEEQAKSIEDSKLPDEYKKMAAAGVGLYDAQNRLVTKYRDAVSALTQGAVGASIPDAATLMRQMAPQIEAQKYVERATLGFAQNTTIPQQWGIGVTQNPALLGDQTKALRALGATDLGPLAAQFRQIQLSAGAMAAASVEFVRTTLTDMPGMADQYAQALGNASKAAQQIAGIQIGVETKQAAYAAAQYQYNLYVGNRNLRDALGLTGKITNATDNLGVVQREMFYTQRQGQQLSFALTQRQINLQRAVAGFVAPGLTPAEMAARQDEAKLEADYAQKQLDIQKELFALQGQQFTISASRQVIDLVRQLGLLRQGYELQLDTAKAQKQITALSAVQALAQQQADAIYSSAVGRTQDVISLTGKLVSSTVEGLDKVEQAAVTAFRNEYAGIIAAINGWPGQTGPGGGGGKPLRNAAGAMFSTAGTTYLGAAGVAGEAGSEFVAILRNPRPIVGADGSGGGGSATVNFSGPIYVRSEADITALARKVASALGRDAQLRGLRPIGVS